MSVAAGLFMLGLLLIGLIAITVPVNTTGIVITHNGNPVYNIAVSATYKGANGPFSTGTTEGSGVFTAMTNLGNTQTTILFDFTYAGTGYSFEGSATKIITVSV